MNARPDVSKISFCKENAELQVLRNGKNLAATMKSVHS